MATDEICHRFLNEEFRVLYFHFHAAEQYLSGSFACSGETEELLLLQVANG